MSHRSTEDELVRAVTAGDKEAYAILYDRLAPLVRAVCHDYTRNLADAQIESIQSWSEEEAHASSLGCAFIEQLPEGSDWRYVGEDVQLGDASKAVCWWKPPGSSTYRVVYGDLSVRDVAPSDLPPIPWLAEQK